MNVYYTFLPTIHIESVQSRLPYVICQNIRTAVSGIVYHRPLTNIFTLLLSGTVYCILRKNIFTLPMSSTVHHMPFASMFILPVSGTVYRMTFANFFTLLVSRTVCNMRYANISTSTVFGTVHSTLCAAWKNIVTLPMSSTAYHMSFADISTLPGTFYYMPFTFPVPELFIVCHLLTYRTDSVSKCLQLLTMCNLQTYS
jgi:hypothetical protein